MTIFILNLVVTFGAVLFFIPSLIYAFCVKAPEIRRIFIKIAIISISLLLLAALLTPLFHQNDNCKKFYHCPRGEICPLVYSEGVPCLQPIDVIFPMLLIVPLVLTIIGLVKAKKMHCKIWPFFLIFSIMVFGLFLLSANQ